MPTRPVYTRNPRRVLKASRGLKVADAITGKWTYLDYTLEDDDGNTVDPRDRRSWDRRWDLDGDNEGGRS